VQEQEEGESADKINKGKIFFFPLPDSRYGKVGAIKKRQATGLSKNLCCFWRLNTNTKNTIKWQ